MSDLLEISKRYTPRWIKRLLPVKVKEQAKVPITALTRWYRGMNAESRALPNFIIAGAQKCGTSTLNSQLSQHPNVIPSFIKEVNYFNWNYGRGLNWYKAHFPITEPDANRATVASSHFITGEASPYYMFYPYALERIAKTLPEVRIMMMLRNPVDRAFSSYQHQRRKGREKHSFEEAIDLEPMRLAPEIEKIERDESYFSYNHAHFSYLARGLYVDQVKRCLKHFPKERFLIIESERFFGNSAAIYEEVLEFLGLPAFKLPEYSNLNKYPYEKMKPETRKRLVEYFRPHNKRLYELLGRQFDWDN